MSLLRWGWMPLVGLGLIAWGYFGAPAPEATEIFSTAALFILTGGAVFLAGLIVLVVLYTGEQNRRRAQAHRSSDNWPSISGT